MRTGRPKQSLILTVVLVNADPFEMMEVRHPPQSGWLDGLGRLKGGRWLYLGVARCAPQFTVQN